MENKREFDEFAQDYRKILDNNLNKLSSAKNEYFCEYKIKEVFNQLKKLPNRILLIRLG